MKTEFSVDGSPSQKKALVEDAIRKFDLSLGSHLAASFWDVIKFGRVLDGCIVGEESASILTVGGRKSNHYVLPQDYDKAMEAIGGFFGRGATPAAANTPPPLPAVTTAVPTDLRALRCSECGRTGSAQSAMSNSLDGRAVERAMSSIGQCPKCKRLICGRCSRKLNFTCPVCRVDFVNL